MPNLSVYNKVQTISKALGRERNLMSENKQQNALKEKQADVRMETKVCKETPSQNLNFEGIHKEDLKRLQNFRLLDDDFMTKVFEDEKCAEFLLQIILERDDLIVVRSTSQYSIKNLQGRSVRLDILAVDREKHVYNIEVQRSDKGAGVKRARYNSSILDANLTQPGDQYENLNETYVIFITENDALKRKLPIYHIDRVIRETGEVFEDESHIIYVNSKVQDDTALGKLMHDFSCKKAENMYYKVLADRVHYFKEDEEGVAIMCRAMEEMRNEAVRKRNIEIAMDMLDLKKTIASLTYENISKTSKLTVDEVKQLEKEINA